MVKSALKKRATTVIATLKKLFPEVETSLNYHTPWEFLVAVILSAQCTDKRVNIVTKTLFSKYKSLDDYANADPEEFEIDIKSTGFYRHKAKNIISSAKILKNDFGGIIPRNMEKLMTFPGVARKTANVVLGAIYHKAQGIAVDTHVKRLSKLHGLTENDDPVKIEQDLIKIIPKKEWIDITMRIIEYGRKYCPAVRHNHLECPLTIALSK